MWQDILRLIRWDKPIGSLLLLWPTWWGLWLAYGGVPPSAVWLVFTVGVFLTRSAGCAINDVADSEFDGKVERTRERPLAARRLSRISGVIVTIILSGLAFSAACLSLKPLTLLYCVPALALLVIYPFCKRFFAIPQLVLAIAFSFGILMAFIEANGQLSLVAWLLFAANVLWVIAYDTLYALVDIDDDLKIGIKTSAITFGRWVHAIILACYGGFYALLLLAGYCAALTWPYYGVLVVTILLTWRVVSLMKKRERMGYFQAFIFNKNIGMLIFIGIALCYWPF